MRLLFCLLVVLGAPGAAAADDLVPAGRENWERPWVPDLRRPDARVEIPAARRVDVLILGDGYLAPERALFERDVKDWYDRFLTYTPWRQFRGAFRVRGLWTPGEGRATPERLSHYKIPATATGVGDVNSADTRRAIFAAIDAAGASKAERGGRLTHATVVMLVKNELGRNPSGMSRGLASPEGKLSVSAGFAAYTHHEFGHAYGGLRDEYISGIGSRSSQRAPDRLSIYSVSNIAYTKDPGLLPWAHLAPGGRANPDPRSVIGVLWVGGVAEEGAWHSEARCLMNGTHENWDLQKTRRGVGLRDVTRFCFWCEEILVARTLEKTGQLGDPADGEALWKKWAEEVRPLYHKAFDVAARIKAQNEVDARANLAGAKIYERPVP